MPCIDAPPPAFFFSDVHLGSGAPDAERSKEAKLLAFLEMVRATGGSLCCLGDLFDFWFEYESTIPRRFFTLLRRLKELSESGIRLYFMGGNHDYWVRRNRRPGFLEEEIGFVVLPDVAEVRVGRLHLLLFHGDGIGPHDRGYRLLKRVLRNRLAIGAFRWIHPDLARRIGLLTSRASRLKTRGHPSEETCARLRAHATELLRSRPELDAVIAGHTHRAEETSLGRARYLNLGDWTRRPAYAVADGETISLRWLDTVEEPEILPA